MSGFDAATGGIDFGSRLISNLYSLHRRDQDQERDQANASRESMLSILTAAANSGNINPEDMPTLIKTLFEVSSVKPDKKAIDAVGQHVQQLFTSKTTARKGAGAIGPSTSVTIPAVPGATPPGTDAPMMTPEHTMTMRGVPVDATVQTPAIRMMSPEDRTAIAIRGEVAKRRAIQPFDIQKIQETGMQRRLAQSEKMTQQQVNDLAKVNAQTKGRAQQRVTALAYAYEQQGYDPDDALQLAGKAVLREQSAKVGLTESQSKLAVARIADMQGRLDDTKARTNLMKLKTDAYVSRMAKLNATPLSARTNVAVFRAMIGELLPERTAINRMIIRLENDPNIDTEDEEIQADLANLKSQLADIDGKIADAKTQFLPNDKAPLPNAFGGASVTGSGGSNSSTSTVPEVPTGRTAKKAGTYNVPLSKYGLTP